MEMYIYIYKHVSIAFVSVVGRSFHLIYLFLKTIQKTKLLRR